MRKIKQKIFIFSIFLTLLLTVFTINPMGSPVFYTTSFEDGILTHYDADGTSYTNYWLNCQINPPGVSQQFYINDLQVYDGSKSFYIDGGYAGGAWWNYTYSVNKYLTKWENWFYMDTTGGSAEIDIYFYNGSDIPSNFDQFSFIHLHLLENGEHCYYYDHNGNPQEIGDFQNQAWHKIGFEIIDQDSVSYFFNNTYYPATPRNTSMNRIDSVRFEWIGTPETSIDNHRICIDNSFISGEGVACGEFPDMSYLGKITTEDIIYQQVIKPTIEFNYNVPIETTLYYLDLYVGLSQMTYDNDLSHYSGYINGHNIGTPDCVFSYLDGYVMRWEFLYGIPIINQTVLVEINHYTGGYNCYITEECHTEYGWFDIPWGWTCEDVEVCTYWSLPVCLNDIDQDGDISYRQNGNNFNVGSYDGELSNYDVCYKLYYETMNTYNDKPGYANDDILIISGNNGNVLADGTPLFFMYETAVFISYIIEDLTVANYIRIWDMTHGVEVGLTQGFGLGNMLQYFDRTLGFIPYNTGLYKANIYRNGANVTSKTFYVASSVDESKLLYTVRNPSNLYNSYNVFYNYTHPDGWKGAIGMSYDNTNFNRKDDCEYWVDSISSGTNGVFVYTPENIQSHYWRFFVSINNGSSFVPFSGIHTHYIYDNVLFENTILVNTPVIDLAADPSNQKSVIISGTHNHLGADIYIRINSNIFASVKDTQSFQKFYYPSTSGNKNASLDLYNNGTWITLDYVFFMVGDKSESSADSGVETIFSTLPIFYKVLIALVIIIVLSITPFALGVFLAKANMSFKLPELLYVSFFFLGIIVTVFMGLLDAWVFFVVLFALIITFAILWLQRGLRSGE